jgi:hypothetical protein
MLLLVHTAASSGMVLSMHYCMGSFASMHIGHRDEQGCSNCGMEKSDCCHDDVKLIKIDGSQFVSSFVSDVIHPDTYIHHNSSDWSIIGSVGCKNYPLFTETSSKNQGGPPIFLLNCNFRI